MRKKSPALTLKRLKLDIAKNLRDRLEDVLSNHIDQFVIHANEGRGFAIHVLVLNQDGSKWDPANEPAPAATTKPELSLH